MTKPITTKPIFDAARKIEALDTTAEVVGKGDLRNGIYGGSQKQTGVIGHSDTYVGVAGDGDYAGVVGYSRAGTGVLGESPEGIGVHGKGGRLAGLFEGKVNMTGSLTVQNIDLGSLVLQLQQRIIELEASASRITRGGVPTHLPLTRPTIQVTLHPGRVGVEGQGFSSFGRIRFNIFNLTKQSQVTIAGQGPDPEFTSTLQANRDGTLSFDEYIACHSGDALTFSATDGRDDPNDLTGILWSNTETKVAP
jgi:hypothetical protein